jgi:hypothetical protein
MYVYIYVQYMYMHICIMICGYTYRYILVYIEIYTYIINHHYRRYFTGWLQHAVRQKSYGMQINKVNLVHDTKGPLLMSLMKKLVGLCGHEYDLIRRKSLIIYVNLAAPFGKNDCVYVEICIFTYILTKFYTYLSTFKCIYI